MKGTNGGKRSERNVHLFHYVSCHPVQRWGGDGKTKRAELRSGMFLVLPLRHNIGDFKIKKAPALGAHS